MLWLQSLHKCTALALRSRAGIGESETSTQPRVLSPHKTHKSPTNPRAAKITIAKSSARYIKHTLYRMRHQTERGLMPQIDGWPPLEEPRWLAPLEASASQGTEREVNPEGHGYTSADVGHGPESEST